MSVRVVSVFMNKYNKTKSAVFKSHRFSLVQKDLLLFFRFFFEYQ